MILDQLNLLGRYASLHPGFAAAQVELERMLAQPPDDGRYGIDGERLLVIVARDQGRGRAASPLEFHRRYIDIQVVLEGCEEIGWRPLADCRQLQQPYDDARDIGFYADRPDTWLSLPRGSFAIFYPDDAHAPLATETRVTKAVAKVAVEW
ncbi:MAG: YhcH/YjgK/YiaL family protein [Pirellulales bacterium]